MHLSLPSLRSAPAQNPLLDALLRGVLRATGLNLSGYRRTSLTRRLHVRMEQVGVEDYGAYAAYCESVPDEYARLAQTVLIHVTAFFRDPPVWETVAADIIPRLLARTTGRIQVWCAGCASGEEAYTLAMLLADAVGIRHFSRRVFLRATDVSARMVEQARRGVYSEAAVRNVPPRLRDAFLMRTPDGWAVCAALRDAVRFECYDLTRDPVPHGLHFISCRNTLMYFDLSSQDKVLAEMAHALRPGGSLLLGQAEGILPGHPAFVPRHGAHRLFVRRPENAAWT